MTEFGEHLENNNGYQSKNKNYQQIDVNFISADKYYTFLPTKAKLKLTNIQQ